ncbi:MAG: hypothetical protein CMI54_05840 [Parcubacteria group bacterium]|nr:hypothetical protein [Parcubacteria group bacterium]|tara:strand:- start:11684 stop:11869 length:186 start_codon:yes stop_codon:yes gene_type:complete
MKFYEIKQQLNNLQWQSLGYFKKEEDAEKYSTLYNTKIVVYPTKIVEHEFKNIKDFEEEFD